MGEPTENFARDPFEELVAAEPPPHTPEDVARWVDTYSRLVAMLERQLEDTRAVAERSPAALQRYLGEANLAVLNEEYERFSKRLAYWRAQQGAF